MKNFNLQKFFTNKLNIVLLAVLCMLLWGSACPVIKIGFECFKIDGDEIFSKLLFAGIRFTSAGIIVLCVVSLLKRKFVKLDKKSVKSTLALGFVQTTVQYIFFYIGLSNTTAFKSAVLTAAGTFFLLIFASILYKDDRLSVAKIIGCIVGFSGVIITNINSITSHTGISLIGEGFVLISAIAFAVSSIMSKEATSKFNAFAVISYSLIFGGSTLIIIGLCGGGCLENISIKGILILMYLAMVSSTAVTTWTLLLRYNKAGKIGIYNFLLPVFSAILSALLLKEEVFTFINLLALFLVCIGIYIVNREPSKK